jgi:choline-sulfatase
MLDAESRTLNAALRSTSFSIQNSAFSISLALLAAVLLAATSACSRKVPTENRRNLVLVTIDTLRADRLGRGIAPTLDSLASDGVEFVNARTTVPLTLPAHVSLMTGTTPPVHGVRDNGIRFEGSIPTIARLFRDAGYRTGAFVGAYVLDRRFGLSDGFETYDDRIRRNPASEARLEAERRGGEVVDAAIRWLDSTSAPLFLWVHLYDPHAPYDPPAEFRGAGSNLYDGEVRYADAQVARLLTRVRERGFWESTVTIVAGDHGEGLGDHGEQTHGLLAYDSTLKVPLVVVARGLSARRIDTPVSLVDVAPALLRLTRISGDLAPGASRIDLFESRARSDVYAETQYPRAAGWHSLTVLVGEQWKLVVSSEKELYDLREDPQELQSVAAERPEIVNGMNAVLTRIQTASPPAAAGTVTPEAAERLRTLGYVGGSASSHKIASSAPNPARVVDAWTTFERALGRLNGGRAKEAVSDLHQLAARFPDGLVFQTTYARALQEIGKTEEAVKVLRSAVDRWPADATLFHDLAVAARTAGNTKEAMRAEQAALAVQDNNPAALNGLGLLHADAGRTTEASAAFERAANADPSNASYWSNLGNARRASGNTTGAEAAYRRALEADPGHADAANGLGVLLVQSGRPADAVKWFERALQTSPDFHEARLNLGIAYQESGQREKAIAMYREVLAKAPAQSRERKGAAELLRGLR